MCYTYYNGENKLLNVRGARVFIAGFRVWKKEAKYKPQNSLRTSEGPLFLIDRRTKMLIDREEKRTLRFLLQLREELLFACMGAIKALFFLSCEQ